MNPRILSVFGRACEHLADFIGGKLTRCITDRGDVLAAGFAFEQNAIRRNDGSSGVFLVEVDEDRFACGHKGNRDKGTDE